MESYVTEPYVRPDVAGFLAFLSSVPGPQMHELEVPVARATYVGMRDVADLPIGDLATITDLTIPGPAGDIPARLFDVASTRPAGPLVVFFHGGGFVIGDLDSHASFCAELTRALDLPVLAIHYRLAPENPWPAAPQDCEAAARWAATSPAELGRTVASLVVCGDSAGGNLSVTTAIALRDAPAAVPIIAQVPFYPVVDTTRDYPSATHFGEGFMLTQAAMEWFDAAYQADAAHVTTSPLTGELAGLPPAVVVSASLDPLRDQGRAYAAALAVAGVPVVFREAVGNIHGFVTLRKAIPSSVDDVAGALAAAKALIAEARA
ncbi:lipase [Sphingomonas sp. HMWF008]|nr:lipase [Sphingomonas sp. HMWF008]